MKGDSPFRIPNRMGSVPIGFATGGRQREGGCPQPPSLSPAAVIRRACPQPRGACPHELSKNYPCQNC